MVSDLLATFLLDADLYDPTSPLPAVDSGRQQQLGQGPSAAGSTAALNFALQHHVLPLVPGLLQQEDPMPLYALKVLQNILPSFVKFCASTFLHGNSSFAH
jgi:serine/threonine-protein kinase ULK4